MAVKKCPFCGKKIAAQAQYCIYCSRRLNENAIEKTQVVGDLKTPEETFLKKTTVVKEDSKKHFSQSKLWLAISVVALIAIVVALVLIIASFVSTAPPSIDETLPTATTTAATRDPQRDTWLQSFTGRWVDESSTGKGDLEKQGGQMLFIHEIRRDTVLFDLLSYSGGDKPTMAFVNGVEAALDDDTLHFEFTDDGCGHGGEGYMRLRDGGIDLEILIDGADKLSEEEHSLALNAVFARLALPQSSGYDLQMFSTLDDVRAVAGDETSPAVKDEKSGDTTYTFGMLSAVIDQNGTLKRLTVNFNGQENKAAYCFDCVDGTMTYDTVKSYFGEAMHDYVEQPTNIRVLHYEMSDKGVTFTFDAEDNLLVCIDYIK